MGEGSEPSDHDLLIRIDERVRKLDMCMSNHLSRHWSAQLAGWGALAAALTAVGAVLWQLLTAN